MAPSLDCFSCSTSVILNPSPELSMDSLILLFKVSLMNVFPYLVPAFGKIAASKEHSLTQLCVGEALKKDKLFILM